MVAQEHERIEELLAGYVLQSLSGADAAEADRLLTEHVPTCPMCRDALADFQAVTGELALTIPPLAPPETLYARLRRDIPSAPSSNGRRWIYPPLAAASFVALVAVAGLALSLSGRVDKAERQRSLVAQALSDASVAGTTPVGLQGAEGNRPDGAMIEVSGPQIERFTLYGDEVPDPRPGDVYRLWLGRGGTWDYQGEFVPDGGYVGFSIVVDTSLYDTVLITEEPADRQPTTPSSDWAWSSPLKG
jgi:hypothetical protein